MFSFLTAINRAASHAAKALLLALVLLQFSVVIIRYVFGANFLWAQEAALAAHGAVFMLAAGWTLMVGRHVAIDVFSSKASPNRKRLIAASGFALLLLPMMIAIVVFSFPHVAESWRILEGSREVSGLPGLFLLKSLIPVFALLMICAGCATSGMFRNVGGRQDRP